MIANYCKYGFLAPMMFFHKEGQTIFFEIPDEALASQSNKELLAKTIQHRCHMPDVIAAGIIIEAYCTPKLASDDPLIKQISKGKTTVSQLPDKRDIIFMIFSTPLTEEFIGCFVDPEKKTIIGNMDSEDRIGFGGTFSQFFKWNKN